MNQLADCFATYILMNDETWVSVRLEKKSALQLRHFVVWTLLMPLRIDSRSEHLVEIFI